MISLLNADARQIPLRDKCIQCVCTSPPFYNQRNYGVDGQIGLEAEPLEYVEELVLVFREVRRVLRDDGVAWLNLGFKYAQSGGAGDYGFSDGGARRGVNIKRCRAAL